MRTGALSLVLLIAGCSDGGGTFTLYRNSVLDAQARIHVGSFDSTEGRAYNSENCERAAALFSAQPLVEVAFWCEPGRYRKKR